MKPQVRNMNAVRTSEQVLPQPSSINFSWSRHPPQRKIKPIGCGLSGPEHAARAMINQVTSLEPAGNSKLRENFKK